MKFWPESEKWKIYWWINEEEINYILTEKLRNIIQEDEVIISKIRSLKEKWKSKLYIKQKLFERMENKDLIEKYLEEAFIEWELSLVKKEYEKIIKRSNIDWVWKNKEFSYEENQKIIEKLMRKWFKYDDIKIVLKHNL
jgi:SOS response regulatory protein OraA/RecX